MNNDGMMSMHVLQKEKQLRQMEREFIALQNEYHKILDSKFWKSTQWIRNIINFIRKPKTAEQPQTEQIGINDAPVQSTYRIPAESVYVKCKEYDVISFDIFDTLVLRNCKNPVDVFDMVSLNLGYESFAKLRVEAEQEARKNVKGDEKEVTLDEIYDILCKWIALDKEKAMKAEIDAEKVVCVPNPYMKQVFDMLRATDKTIIIASDMYLPKSAIEEILDKCGYFGYDKLYVSNDIMMSKATGSMYEAIKKDYPDKNIIHLGDNYISDIVNSDKAGFKNYYYPASHAIADRELISCDSPTGSIYQGLVINKLYSGADRPSISYRHGYMYGGMITTGYCNWLNFFAKENDVDKILFLARDAEILQTVYKRNIDEVPSKYMVVSRFAMWQIVFELHTEEYIRFFFKNRAQQADTKMEDALKETGLDFLVDSLEEYKLNNDDILDNDTYKTLREMIYDNRDIIIEEFAPKREAAVKYFNECFGDAKKILLSDVGWSGQILLHMRHFVRDIMKREDIEIIGAFLATSIRKDVNHYINAGILNAYLYTYGQNREMYMPIDNFAGNTAVMCLEAMFSSSSPTLMEYALDKDGEYDFVYGVETANPDNLNDIQKGILDFTKDWFAVTDNLGINFEVTPADAFSPYESVAMDWAYLSQIFGSFIEYTDSIPRLGKARQSTTLREIMHVRGLY